MADPLEPAVPQRKERTEAKTFAELREEYRAANLKRVRAMTRPDDLQIKDAAGNVVKRVSTGLRTTAPAGQDFRKPDEFLATGEVFPDFTDMPEEFETLPIPSSEARDLAKQAKDVTEGERVRYPGNPSGDESREGPPLESLDEESLLAYTEANVRRECPAGLTPHLQPGGHDATLQADGHQSIRQGDGRSQAKEKGNTPGGGSSGREKGTGNAPETSGPDTPGQAYHCARLAIDSQGYGCLPPGTIASVPARILYPVREGPGSIAHRPWFQWRAADTPTHVSAPRRWWRLFIAFVRRRLY